MKGGRLYRHRYLGNTGSLDYIGLSQKCEKPLGGRPQQDHSLTIETAKQGESLTPFSISGTVIVEGWPAIELSRTPR